MKNIMMLTFLILTALVLPSRAQVTRVNNVTLKDAVTGKEFSLSDFSEKRGIVVIFTSNYCPFSKQYIDRINELHRDYKDKGFQLVLINSNSESDNPIESVEEMANKAKDSGFEFPYLADKERVALEQFKASRTPEAFLLRPDRVGFAVVYSGAIDDNPQMATQVRTAFLRNAMEDVIAGRTPARNYVRPTGCVIRN
jgi:glutathione peroxidase-family protein